MTNLALSETSYRTIMAEEDPQTVMIESANDGDGLQFSAFVSGSGGQPYYKSVFGQYTYNAIMENSIVALKASSMAEDGTTKMEGFIAVSNTQLIDSFIDDTIAAHLSKLPDVSVMNSMILSFFALENQSESDNYYGMELLQALFTRLTDIDTIFFISPAKARLHQFMMAHFTEIDGVLDPELFAEKKLYSLDRNDFLPKLIVRKARVEDNDDLLPIVESSLTHLAEEGNDFVLANMIQNQNETNRILVGVDDSNSPLGMLCITRDVEFQKLSKIYNLTRYHAFNIGKLLPSESRHKPTLILLVGELSAIGSDLLREGALSLGFLYFDAEEVEQENAQENNDDGNYLLEVFRHRLDKLLSPISGSAPKGCVLGGYPLNVEEANRLKYSDFFFDYVIEIKSTTNSNNTSTDGEGVPPQNPALHKHLEAVKALHEDDAENSFTRAHWIDVPFDANEDKADIASRLLGDLIRALTTRNKDTYKGSGADTPATVLAATVYSVRERVESRSDDMVLAAFKDNPDFDFFFYLQSNEAPATVLASTMTVIPVRDGMTTSQSLYLIHRDCLVNYSKFIVCRYDDTTMRSELEAFLHSQGPTAPTATSLIGASLACVHQELSDNPVDVCFVARIDVRIVAFVNLTRKSMSTEDFIALRKRYSIDRLIEFNRHRTRAQAFLQHWLMDPIYERRSSYFLTEMMRQYGKTLLYYYDYPKKNTQSFVLRTLFPVRPRVWNDSVNNINANATVPSTEKGATLYLISKRLLTKKRKIVESKVVIVGGSANSFSMLDAFVYNPSVYMTNIRIILDVVPHALYPYHNKENPDIKYWNGFTGCFSVSNHQYLREDELLALGLYRRVKVQVGRLTDIDRSSRAIIISDKSVVDYDILVISVSVQDVSHHYIPTLKGTHPLLYASRGVFSLGSVRCDSLAMQWIKHEESSSGARDASISSNVVVYGSTVSALHVIDKLLQLQIDPADIIWVYRAKPEFGYSEIDDAIENAYKSVAIMQYKCYEIVDVLFDARKFVKGVQIRPVVSATTAASTATAVFQLIPCCTLLLVDRMKCDIESFAAINEAGLVYDGGLVVDENFCTNDQHIYGVGDFTRYSRKHRNVQDHALCNQAEMGEYVAWKILDRILSSASTAITTTPAEQKVDQLSPVKTSRTPVSLHVFARPRTESARAPLNMHFVRSSIPCDKKQTNVMSTRNKLKHSVCAIRFDFLGNITEFLYVGKEPLDCINVSRLVGKHESFVHNAMICYEKGLVEDWVTFLQEPWADILNYDSFDVLQADLRSRFKTAPGYGVLLKNVFENASCTDDDLIVAGGRRRYLGDHSELLDNASKSALESVVTEFVRDHKDFLPVFAIPKHASKTVAE